MEDFEIVYEKDKVFGDYLKCNHCGERVERGIAPVSHHSVHCPKKTEGVIAAETYFQKQLFDSWSANLPRSELNV